MRNLVTSETVFYAIVCIIAIYVIKTFIQMKIKGIRLCAKIVGFTQDKNKLFFSVVEFQHEGNTYSFPTNIGHRKKKGHEGDFIDIYYLPKNQNHVLLAKDSYYVSTGIFVIIGICVLLYDVFM